MSLSYKNYNDGKLLKDRYLKLQDISEGSFGIVSLAKDTRNDNKLIAVKYITQLSSDFKYSHEEEGESSKSHGQVQEKESHLGSLPEEKLEDSNSDTKEKEKEKTKKNRSVTLLEAEQEINILNALGKHPHITQLYDSFDCYILLEYCSRGDLYDAIRIGMAPSSTKDVIDVFMQLIDAVEYAHGLGIYHRDIKPENILIAEDWSIKLTDWGLATNRKICSDFDVGSERYMAPELLDHANIDSYSADMVDVWSMGICLLNIVFGKNPFTSASSKDKLFLLFAANRETLFDIFPSMSYDLFAVLRYSLTIDPSNRRLASMKEQLLKMDHLVIDYEFNEITEAELLGQETIFESSVEPEEHSVKSIVTQDTELSDQSSGTPMREKSMSIPVIKVASVREEKESVQPEVHTKTEMPYRIPIMRDRDNSTGKGYNNHNNNHRGTRKPLGIPNSRINDMNLNYRHKSQNGRIIRYRNNNYYGNNTGNSHNSNDMFRRQDFFTPKSVFNHYMDKASQNKNNPIGSDLAKDQQHSNRKRGWRRNYNHRNSMSTAHKDKDHLRTNNGLYGKSYKGYNNYNGYFKNDKKHSSYTGKVSSITQGFKDIKLSPHQHDNDIGDAKVPGSLGTSGKYIPPSLRLLRSPLSRPIEFDEDALESDEDIDEVDDEVFMLEDIKHSKKSSGNGAFNKTASNAILSTHESSVHRFTKSKKDAKGELYSSLLSSPIPPMSGYLHGENTDGHLAQYLPKVSTSDDEGKDSVGGFKIPYTKYVPPHQRRNSHSAAANHESRMLGVLKRQHENFDKYDKHIGETKNIEIKRPFQYEQENHTGVENSMEGGSALLKRINSTISTSVPVDTNSWFSFDKGTSKLDWFELDSSDRDFGFMNDVFNKVNKKETSNSSGNSSTGFKNESLISTTEIENSSDTSGSIGKSEAKVSVFKVDTDRSGMPIDL